MPSRIKLGKQRLVMAKMVLRMLQLLINAYMREEMFGSQSDDALLLFAIYVGQAERRPMTASKLAEYVGMPRPTVVRKLREMQGCGLIELESNGAAMCSLERLNDPAMVAAIEGCIRAVQNAAAELSKMDGKGIAPGESP